MIKFLALHTLYILLESPTFTVQASAHSDSEAKRSRMSTVLLSPSWIIHSVTGCESFSLAIIWESIALSIVLVSGSAGMRYLRMRPKSVISFRGYACRSTARSIDSRFSCTARNFVIVENNEYYSVKANNGHFRAGKVIKTMTHVKR